MEAPELQDMVLAPGDWWLGIGRHGLRTLLGSCVAVVLWHPRRRIGGMCHVVLPARVIRSPGGLSGRYADEALELLAEAVARHGTRPGEYRTGLYGGAQMLAGLSQPRPDGRCSDVACRNLETVRQLLDEWGFPRGEEDTGGTRYRTLRLDLASGELLVHHGARPLPTAGQARPPKPGA
jgi:chemotaxis protein CheD